MPMTRAAPLLRWLPIVVTAVVVLIDIVDGREFTYLPLIALGPAFASLSSGVLGTALIGLAAVGLEAGLSLYDGVLGHQINILIMLTTVGVTAAAMLASAGRCQRERELADVRHVAEVAQRVLLRPVPRAAGPVQVAVRYMSAAAEARIGGDLYEVVTTPAGVRIVVGDVQGSGLEAVETAATVLGAFREAAYDEPDLPGVAARLERALARLLTPEQFVTAVLCEINRHDRLTLLNRGHPAPLLIQHGEAGFAEPADPAPPLGMSWLLAADASTRDIPFDADDQILLYTDGVIEARDPEGRFYPLADRASLLKVADAEEALSSLQEDLMQHVGGPLDDDVAMLLVRRATSL